MMNKQVKIFNTILEIETEEDISLFLDNSIKHFMSGIKGESFSSLILDDKMNSYLYPEDTSYLSQAGVFIKLAFIQQLYEDLKEELGSNFIIKFGSMMINCKEDQVFHDCLVKSGYCIAFTGVGQAKLKRDVKWIAAIGPVEREPIKVFAAAYLTGLAESESALHYTRPTDPNLSRESLDRLPDVVRLLFYDGNELVDDEENKFSFLEICDGLEN